MRADGGNELRLNPATRLQQDMKPVYDIFSKDARFRCTLQQELYRPEYWCEIMPAKRRISSGQKLSLDKISLVAGLIMKAPLYTITGILVDNPCVTATCKSNPKTRKRTGPKEFYFSDTDRKVRILLKMSKTL